MNRYPIPQHHLTTAIESLHELALRLEVEAAAYAQMNTHDSVLLADDRLEQAGSMRKAAEYFTSLLEVQP